MANDSSHLSFPVFKKVGAGKRLSCRLLSGRLTGLEADDGFG
jgi:hypothetical protein